MRTVKRKERKEDDVMSRGCSDIIRCAVTSLNGEVISSDELTAPSNSAVEDDLIKEWKICSKISKEEFL